MKASDPPVRNVVAVADTSPINYLVAINLIEILPRLYQRIAIPPAVLSELGHPLAPRSVRTWTQDRPDWLEVIHPEMAGVFTNLDAGETEAIALAIETHAGVLLIDEQAGRREARRQGLKVAGTISILDEADQLGLADFEAAVAQLRKTSFRVSQAVITAILERRSR